MRQELPKVVLQLGVLGSLWGGVKLAGMALRQKPDPEVVEALDAVRAHEMHAVFVQSLTELSKVVVEEKREAWALFLGQIVSLLREDMASTPSSQWKIGRAIRPLSAEAVSLCQTDPRTTSSDLFRRMTDVQETTIPQLQAHLETVLHNHLLKMRGS